MGDSNGAIWEDKTYLKVYRDKFDLNIRSAGVNVKGYIILPNKNVKNIGIKYINFSCNASPPPVGVIFC